MRSGSEAAVPCADVRRVWRAAHSLSHAFAFMLRLHAVLCAHIRHPWIVRSTRCCCTVSVVFAPYGRLAAPPLLRKLPLLFLQRSCRVPKGAEGLSAVGIFLRGVCAACAKVLAMLPYRS